jgi:hypothetical protein
MRSRATTIALACAAAILVLGPLAFTLLRAEDYASSTTVRMKSSPLAEELPDSLGLEFIAGLFDVRGFQRTIARQTDWPTDADDLPEYLSVRAAGDGSFVVTARAPSADQAHELATVGGREISVAAENGVRFFLGGQLAGLDEQLRDDDLEPVSRLELTRERDEIAAVVNGDVTVYEQAPPPATKPKERLADRLLGALPGSRPERPNPLWAALAGAALAVALLAWVFALSPQRRSGAPSA